MVLKNKTGEMKCCYLLKLVAVGVYREQHNHAAVPDQGVIHPHWPTCFCILIPGASSFDFS